MLQDRQIDRLVSKVQRLADMYGSHLIKEKITPPVTMERDGKSTPITEGELWGSDFALVTFALVAEGLAEGEKYYICSETGASEHLV